MPDSTSVITGLTPEDQHDWFLVCLGARLGSLAVLDSLGPHEIKFADVIEQANSLIEVSYGGDVQLFIQALKGALYRTVGQPEFDLITFIKTWLTSMAEISRG